MLPVCCVAMSLLLIIYYLVEHETRLHAFLQGLVQHRVGLTGTDMSVIHEGDYETSVVCAVSIVHERWKHYKLHMKGCVLCMF